MTDAFVFDRIPVRVVFGSGTLAAVPEELQNLGATRALAHAQAVLQGQEHLEPAFRELAQKELG